MHVRCAKPLRRVISVDVNVSVATLLVYLHTVVVVFGEFKWRQFAILFLLCAGGEEICYPVHEGWVAWARPWYSGRSAWCAWLASTPRVCLQETWGRRSRGPTPRLIAPPLSSLSQLFRWFAFFHLLSVLCLLFCAENVHLYFILVHVLVFSSVIIILLMSRFFTSNILCHSLFLFVFIFFFSLITIFLYFANFLWQRFFALFSP